MAPKATKQRTGGGLSCRTKDATEGGGIDGALATIGEIGWVGKFTYGGRFKDSPQAALFVKLEIEGFEKAWEQNYSAGPAEKYEVIADGDGIKALGKATGLNKKSAAYAFFDALESAVEEAGLDIDELLPELDEGGTSVRPLEGRRVRLGNIKFETVGGDIKDLPVIVGFESDEAPAKKNGKTVTTKGTVKASSESVETKTEKVVVGIIEEKTSVKKGDLANLIHQEARKDPDAKAMMNLSFKESWLADEDRPWSYDRKKGILRAKEEEESDE